MALLRLIEELVTRHGLVEFRTRIDSLASRLEDNNSGGGSVRACQQWKILPSQCTPEHKRSARGHQSHHRGTHEIALRANTARRRGFCKRERRNRYDRRAWEAGNGTRESRQSAECCATRLSRFHRHASNRASCWWIRLGLAPWPDEALQKPLPIFRRATLRFF